MEAVWMSVKQSILNFNQGIAFLRGASNFSAWFCFSDFAQPASIYALSAYSRSFYPI